MLVDSSHENYEKKKKKNESGLASSLVCKKMLSDVCTLLVTCKGSINIDSLFDII